MQSNQSQFADTNMYSQAGMAEAEDVDPRDVKGGTLMKYKLWCGSFHPVMKSVG